MILKQIWEYNIYAEFFDRDRPENGSQTKSFNVITNESPLTGWQKVFNALTEAGEMKNLQRIQNASCYQKQIITI